MMRRLTAWLLPAVLLGHTFASPLTPLPLYYDTDGRPFAVASELGQRLASHSHLQEPGDSRLGLPSLLELGDSRLGLPSRLEAGDSRVGLSSRLESGDSRLGLPSLQEIDAIKKVAQILIMLGEQVIPTIIGDIAPGASAPAAHGNTNVVSEDAPNDPVDVN